MKEQSESNLSDKIEQSQDQPCIDLTYLKQRTKSNPELMAEIISAYLVQTPPLISSMKQSLLDKDWDSLRAAVHKLIPSFAIMGISEEAENSAKKYRNIQAPDCKLKSYQRWCNKSTTFAQEPAKS